MPKNDDPNVNAALRKYVTSPAMALSYDRHYDGNELLEFDTRLLEETLPPRGLFLDVGAGTGRHLVTLSGGGRRFVGMDLSRHMLDVAAAKLERASIRAPLVLADMRAPLPFASGSFDGVLCMFSTIGLIPSAAGRAAFVSEAKRILRPGGLFVFHVHNRLYNVFHSWGRFWLLRTYTWDRLFSNLEIGDRIMPSYRGIKHMFLHIFSRDEVVSLVRDSGLELRRLVLLNSERTAEIRGPLPAWRSNGFIVIAAEPTA